MWTGLFEVRAQEYLDSLPGSKQRGVNKFLKGMGEIYCTAAVNLISPSLQNHQFSFFFSQFFSSPYLIFIFCRFDLLLLLLFSFFQEAGWSFFPKDETWEAVTAGHTRWTPSTWRITIRSERMKTCELDPEFACMKTTGDVKVELVLHQCCEHQHNEQCITVQHRVHVQSSSVICGPARRETFACTLLTFQVFSIDTFINTIVQLPYQQEAFNLIYITFLD